MRALADERLPALVSRLRQGEDVDVAAEAPPLELRTRTREITETAEAFSVVQRTAVEAAVGQADLRKGVSKVFRSLARRNQSLLQRQLKMLDEMERGTHDPEALAQLFQLDHLTTRMRRQAEGLIILSGAAPGRGWRQPVPLVEVLRGAIGEIEDYAAGRPGRRLTRLHARHRRRGRDPPARRAGRERRAVLPAAYARPGQGEPGGQRARGGGRGPGARHPGRGPGRAQRAAGPAARVRPGRQRPARPVRGQPGWPPGTRSRSPCAARPTAAPPPSCSCRTTWSWRRRTPPSRPASTRPRAGQHPATPAGQHIGLASRPTSPATARPVSDPATVPPISGPDAGLPRRLRQASLAPQLREPGSPGQAPAGRPAGEPLGRPGTDLDLVHPAGLARWPRRGRPAQRHRGRLPEWVPGRRPRLAGDP